MMDKRDLVGCAVWLILSVFVFTASLRLGVGALRSPGPGFIPFWASIGLAFFACILLAVQSGCKKHKPYAGKTVRKIQTGEIISS